MTASTRSEWKNSAWQLHCSHGLAGRHPERSESGVEGPRRSSFSESGVEEPRSAVSSDLPRGPSTSLGMTALTPLTGPGLHQKPLILLVVDGQNGLNRCPADNGPGKMAQLPSKRTLETPNYETHHPFSIRAGLSDWPRHTPAGPGPKCVGSNFSSRLDQLFPRYGEESQNHYGHLHHGGYGHLRSEVQTSLRLQNGTQEEARSLPDLEF